ncbi:hypothetical protein D5086_008522 [Populus alba]|uniref:Uncharacterized protein n=3 Tax=Populus TaxID=3689 RepID=A0A4V6AA05_POPAL|nr:hypothetical protein NC653_011123 [Populus alba x Populus x berolinensis]TKS07486.1 uncharacterized protein D5086_0000112510 [Populus alba]
MAIELCSDSSAGVSPRISFSHDLCISDIVPVEQRPLRPSSLGNIDFDFCVRKSFDRDSSSADELFSDGKILPTEIKKKTASAKQVDPSMPPGHALQDDISSNDGFKKDCLNEMKGSRYEEEYQKQSSKSFWRFKRSSSLNCASGYGKSLCPLPLLSRSYSTGSTPSSKRAPLSKDTNHKQHRQSFLKPSQSSSSTNYHKPPLKKNYGPYGNGVRVSPVLNVSSGNLFGLGSIFFNGKDKNKKK